MKYLILSVFVVVAVIGLTSATPDDQHYTTKYDGVDLNNILSSDRLFASYFKCIVEDAVCTPDGTKLKEIVPDALSNNCAKCSEKQRRGALTVIDHTIEHRPESWKKLQAKFDPDNLYVTKYREEAKKHNIKL